MIVFALQTPFFLCQIHTPFPVTWLFGKVVRSENIIIINLVSWLQSVHITCMSLAYHKVTQLQYSY